MHSFFSTLLDAGLRLARTELNRPTRYLGAAIVMGLCCALRAQLPDTALPYLFFIPGLMFSGFCFGVGPSALGALLAVLAAQYFFIGPIGFENDGATTWVNTLSFGTVSFGMAVVCTFLRKNLDMVSRINQRLEEEVERRTQERDGIWNVSPDLICAVSASGELLAINPAWLVETGWSEQALRSGMFSTFISPLQLASALSGLEERAVVEFDTEGVRRNGAPLHLNWRIARREGKYFAVARDITLFKERQEALEQVSSQLRQSQKMEAIGQLTGGLAHDFNNLLTVISGSLEMLKARVAQGRVDGLERYLTLAQTASARAGSLTHRLLAYARRQTLASKVIDPALLVQDMKELIARTLTPRVDLAILTPFKVLACYCDAHQLENAVLNLCINARDAMPQGGRLQVEVSQVTIDTPDIGSTLSAGDYAVIRVTDSGTGMPASVVERAFDPFFTTKPLGVGTGLGLSMVYGFARQSSGEARIHSTVGAGTTVSLFLPLYTGPLPLAAASPAVITPASGLSGNGKVLVVDDEVAIRDLVGEVLEDAGYEVTKAGTANDALARLDQLPDLKLLVTDIGLPEGMSGDDLAHAALQRRPGLKVLFITGFSDNAVPTEAFEPGQVQLLRKPFSLEELNIAVAGLGEAVEA